MYKKTSLTSTGCVPVVIFLMSVLLWPFYLNPVWHVFASCHPLPACFLLLTLTALDFFDLPISDCKLWFSHATYMVLWMVMLVHWLPVQWQTGPDTHCSFSSSTIIQTIFQFRCKFQFCFVLICCLFFFSLPLCNHPNRSGQMATNPELDFAGAFLPSACLTGIYWIYYLIL